MSDKEKTTAPENNENYSLNDDRRVKVLSPGALVAKRFFRNRLAVTGMIILIIMFAFSFIGGLVSPYDQDQKFYRKEAMVKEFAGVLENKEFRFTVKDASAFNGLAQAKAILALQKDETSFDADEKTFELEKISDNTYLVSSAGNLLAVASKEIVSSSTSNESFPFDFTYKALVAAASNETEFESEGIKYTLDVEHAVFDTDGKEVATIGTSIVRAVMGDVALSKDFKTKLLEAIDSGAESFEYTDESGVKSEYALHFDASKNQWDVKQEIQTTVFDKYAKPSANHWLGTDRNGMDMLTRLMYGGRVSLIIGFIVVFLETFIGVIFGGISGYFGGHVDNLIMRIVDIFYCIPSMPIIIILGAAMDALSMEPSKRMLMLMVVLGVTGWPGIARLVRGQILSLREQEFMTATEACGISIPRRIFKHLIPNVIPQLIVTMTMGLGGTIITEATLSFLGLGVRFPFASWGNIINDVTNVFVLTHYLNIWIPAGVLLLLTVLAFNIVGDGLRDAFDPKMKR